MTNNYFHFQLIPKVSSSNDQIFRKKMYFVYRKVWDIAKLNVTPV